MVILGQRLGEMKVVGRQPFCSQNTFTWDFMFDLLPLLSIDIVLDQTKNIIHLIFLAARRAANQHIHVHIFDKIYYHDNVTPPPFKIKEDKVSKIFFYNLIFARQNERFLYALDGISKLYIFNIFLGLLSNYFDGFHMKLIMFNVPFSTKFNASFTAFNHIFRWVVIRLRK